MVITNNNINVMSLRFYDKDNIGKFLLGCHAFQSDKKVPVFHSYGCLYP